MATTDATSASGPFQLTPEQSALRETLRDFVSREILPVAHQWEREGRYPTEIVESMKRMGLFGMLVPREYGGADLDPLSYAIVFEELSRGWMGVAGVLGSHSMGTLLLAKYGTAAQRQRWLPALAEGELRSGLALTEPNAGSDLQGIQTTARRDGEHYIVRGTKTWITNARHADPLPTLVKTDPSASPPRAGMSILLVEADTPGFSIGRDLGKLGYKGPESCEVIFDDARVPSKNLLGEQEGAGMYQTLSVLEFGRLNVAGRSVGVAQAALDQALTYSGQRKTFGKAIAQHQAIQLKLADLATEVQAARLMTWWAATMKQQHERADVETAMAKVFASEVALRSTLNAMRVFGGYGYSTEFDVERLYRDAPLMAIGEGTNEILRLLIGRKLSAAAVEGG